MHNLNKKSFEYLKLDYDISLIASIENEIKEKKIVTEMDFLDKDEYIIGGNSTIKFIRMMKDRENYDDIIKLYFIEYLDMYRFFDKEFSEDNFFKEAKRSNDIIISKYKDEFDVALGGFISEIDRRHIFYKLLSFS